jgi:hypothetical protein
MIDHQAIPPSQASELAILSAATSLCLAFKGQLQPSDLQDAMDRGLASVGLKPVPPHQIVLVWGLAAQLVQDPRACPELLKP